MNIEEILRNYDTKNITIAVLGGHSALDVCHGAKKQGFRTLAVCQKGRAETYEKYYKTRNGKGCIDDVIVVDHFKDIVKPEVQQELRDKNCIFIHNRYFWVYCNFEEIEHDFHVPIYGSRTLLKLEERDIPNNQYYLLEKAGIRIPKMWDVPKIRLENLNIIFENKENLKDMDRLTLTKINNAVRTYERENFVASSWMEWLHIVNEKLSKGLITFEDLQVAVIEEFILGAQINFNFFYDALTGDLELMGTDMRRQTNLDGVLRLPAHEQLKIDNLPQYIKHIETGHVAVTCKESLVEKAYEAGEKFLQSCKQYAGQEMIGPFALQGAIDTHDNKEEIVVFDVSMRIPGSPGTKFTPYTGYMFGESMSYGERIGMNMKHALERGKLSQLLT